MSILVTGAAGFIASQVCHRLLAEGHQVIGVDNMNDYYDVRLKDYRKKNLIGLKGFTFKQLDIEDKAAVKKLFEEHKFDVVYNLAARAGVRYSMENPEVYMTTNLMGTLNLLDGVRDHKVRKFVLASTSSLYAGQKMPFHEELAVNTPISPYAASKKAAEMLAYSYHYLYGIDVSVVRYFTVFGPAGRPDMSIFRFIKWIDEGATMDLFGDGGQSRDFTYVEDIARGTILASKNLGYEVINLGGGQNPIALNTVIASIEKYFGKKALIKNLDFHKADIKETWADISKAKRLLGWEPQTSFDQGLQKTLDWYTKEKPWLKDIQL